MTDWQDAPADYPVRDGCVYLVVDPEGGPVRSFPRDRAYEYARNTGGVVAKLTVYTDTPEEAR